MLKNKNMVTIVLLIVIGVLLILSTFNYSKCKRYEGALVQETLSELQQKQIILIEIMKDVIHKDNIYQNSANINNHLFDFENTTILPDEVDMFIIQVIIPALEGYESETDDAKREEYIAIYIDAVMELGKFGELADSIALDEEFRPDEGLNIIFELERSEYTFLVDKYSKGYKEVDSYFKNVNETFSSRLEAIKD